MKGYLFKYSDNVFRRVTVEDFQKRWFVLGKGQLLYFKSNQVWFTSNF
jgi:hypothetical protein